MLNSVLRSCDVRDIIKLRYNWEPIRVEDYYNRTQFTLNLLSSQSNTYTWRPDEIEPSLSAPSTSIQFPLFLGTFDFLISNENQVNTSLANSYVILGGYNLQNIVLSGPFYNLLGETWKAYGIGTYPGATFPTQRQNEELLNISCLTPYIDLTALTDGTGAIYLSVFVTFQGFKITMQ